MTALGAPDRGPEHPEARALRAAHLRRRVFYRRRYQAIFAYTGLIWILGGAIMASPLLALAAYPGEAAACWWGILFPAALLAGAGGICWRAGRAGRIERTLTLSEGAAIVVLAWVGAIAAASVALGIVLDLTLTQAVFEATSAWTTTGLSVVDVTTAPRVALLLRSTLQLAGGAGLAILMVSVMRGPTGPGLAVAEGRGEQLVPHVVQSAKIVVGLYAAYNVAGTVALRVSGMEWFDAVNHAFCATSTGGFSTRPESIGYWDSPLVEAVTLVLMLLGTTNFVTAYLIVRGRVREGLKSGEMRLMAVVGPAAAVMLFATVGVSLYASLGKAVRVAVFETASALSTTGFSTVSYGDWSDVGILVLVGLMLIGGGTGSTAGGPKQARIYILFRVALWEVQRLFLPRTAANRAYLWQGGRRYAIEDAEVRLIAAFLFAYGCVLLLGTAVIAAHGHAIREALFEMASTLGTVGLSVGVTAADAPALVLWTQIVGMLLGRLEIFAVLIGLWRIAVDMAARLSLSPPRRARR